LIDTIFQCFVVQIHAKTYATLYITVEKKL